MTTIRKFLSILFLCIMCQGIAVASEVLVFSNCEMVKVDVNQIVISEEGHYFIDACTNSLVPVNGFINQNNETFAITSSNFQNPKVSPACGHGYGCRNSNCGGCIRSGCWNKCSCKRK